MEITTLIIIAILVEAIVENIKTTYENGINGTRIIALILAIVICILTQTGIFLLLGIDFTLPIVDYILTGIVQIYSFLDYRESISYLRLDY